MTRSWYQVATVRRHAPGPQIAHSAGLPFSPELAPHILHPSVAGDPGRERELLSRALGRYLHATSVLEVRVVNEVASQLAHGQGFFDLPDGARLDSLKLYCDEGYHAVLSSDLLQQLGIDESALPAPSFEGRLAALLAQAGDDDARVVLRFLFAVVTETAISRSLARLARDRALIEDVRWFVREHARDEARHHAFFVRLFSAYWVGLSESEKHTVGDLLPELVVTYLAPDLDGCRQDLSSVGFTYGESARIVAESYPEDVVQEIVLDGARPVLACFRGAGALGRPRTREAFGAHGLHSFRPGRI